MAEFSRKEQKGATVAAIERHELLGESLASAKRGYDEQLSHLEGLLGEVDKLTKGKSLLPVSDLLVELSNSLISDMKGVIFRDTYLDRVKPFVPAGDNPTFPDVLLTLRTLRQGLERFQSMVSTETEKHRKIKVELATILAALEQAEVDEAASLGIEDGNEDPSEEEDAVDSDEDTADEDEEEEFADGEESDDGEEYSEFVREQEVRGILDGEPLSKRWFTHSRMETVFDFERLDSEGLPRYDPPASGITYLKGIPE